MGAGTLILEQRVIHNGSDVSFEVNDYRTGAFTFAYQTGQYLYIGSNMPFNNLWFEMGTLNLVPASVTIEMWWGNEWVSAVDVLDQTNGLRATGRIQWNTDLYEGWEREERAQDVTGLSGVKIYNMFWLRMSWSANLTATMTIKYIGQKFSNDDILASYYPDLSLSTIKAAFETGKTTWDEQHYMAAEHIIRDLKKRGIITSRSQILDYDLFTDASCHKVAEIVYQAFGNSYAEQLKMAREAYKEALNIKYFNVDQNADGRLDPIERNISTGFMTR
jgi:hypothetical protein